MSSEQLGVCKILWAPRFWLCLILFAGIARIVATYPIFCQTYDEAYKTRRGLEWLTLGEYSDVDHPPLGTIPLGIGPFLAGKRFEPDHDRGHTRGNSIFYGDGNYFVTLGLARAGNLPFFVLGSIFVWRWLKRHVDNTAAVLGTLIFTTTPLVLAHAGLATNDVAVTATLPWFIDRFVKWIDQPSTRNGLLLGLLAAFATLTKFSAPVLFAASAVGLVVIRAIVGPVRDSTAHASGTRLPGVKELLRGLLAYLASIGLASLVFACVVWAVYLFSFGPLNQRAGFGRGADAVQNAVERDDVLGTFVRRFETTSVPAPEFWQGLLSIVQKQEHGFAIYFLGENRSGGTWMFFPLLMLLKNPICLLLLLLPGAYALLLRTRRNQDWRLLAPIAVPFCFLDLLVFSDINLGLRHFLPAFPYLAIIAAVGASALLSSGYAVGRASSLILLASHVMPGLLAHPDYIPYFNLLTGSRPQEIAVDSDLDWGQDLQRLGDECRRRGIKRLYLSYWGTADPKGHGVPEFQDIPLRPVPGWIAVSLSQLQTRGDLAWLKQYAPVAFVGKSFFLYQIPDADVEPAD